VAAVRLYGKRFFQSQFDDRITDRKEMRDGMCYDIDTVNRFCNVKVPGSETLVRAWFPQNFETAPFWLKEGTSVRIAHVGGNKSRIEVTGPGLVLPDTSSPPIATGANSVTIGIYPTAPPLGGSVVYISTGTYRINGALYTFAPGGPVMNEPYWNVGDGGDMSGSYFVHPIDPLVEANAFRYDAFAIGADGVVDYIKGDEYIWGGVYGDQTGPQYPLIPSGHVLIRQFILVHPGTESAGVKPEDIGREWVRPYAFEIRSNTYLHPLGTSCIAPPAEYPVGILWGSQTDYGPNCALGSLEWDHMVGIDVGIYDQYGTPYNWWDAPGEQNIVEITRLENQNLRNYGTFDVQAQTVPFSLDGTPNPLSISLGLGNEFTMWYTRSAPFATYTEYPENSMEWLYQRHWVEGHHPSEERPQQDGSPYIMIRLPAGYKGTSPMIVVTVDVLDSSGYRM
jgi:hypothetical protein